MLHKLSIEELPYWRHQLKRATSGDRKAIHQLVELCEQNDWQDDKIYWLQQIDDEADVQYTLGNHYYEKGNEKKAFFYYEKAASQNHADALNNLADMYFNGEGVAINEVKAFHLFMKAAQAGVVEAMFTLGIMYEQGIGIEADEKKAWNSYMNSASGGYIEAQYLVGMIFLEGLLGQQKNINKAVTYFTMAAAQHHVDALFNLGYILSEPEYGLVHGEQAMNYFKQAALLGDTEAKRLLAFHYKQGQVVPSDELEAKKWDQAFNQCHSKL